MMRGTVVSPDEPDSRGDMGSGGGMKSVPTDVVVEASNSGASLKLNDKGFEIETVMDERRFSVSCHVVSQAMDEGVSLENGGRGRWECA